MAELDVVALTAPRFAHWQLVESHRVHLLGFQVEIHWILGHHKDISGNPLAIGEGRYASRDSLDVLRGRDDVEHH
jgi:hypothetical protein